MYCDIVLFTMPKEWMPSDAYQTFQVKEGESIECGAIYNNNYFVLDYGITNEGNWFRCIDLKFVGMLETDLEFNGAYNNFYYKLLYSYERKIFKDKTTIVNRYTIVQRPSTIIPYSDKNIMIVSSQDKPIKIVYENNSEFEYGEATKTLRVISKYEIPIGDIADFIDRVKTSN